MKAQSTPQGRHQVVGQPSITQTATTAPIVSTAPTAEQKAAQFQGQSQTQSTAAFNTGGYAATSGTLQVPQPSLDPIAQAASGRAGAVSSVSNDTTSAMHPHAKLVHDFYTAFANKDGAAMAKMYHPDAKFSDEVFPKLNGKEAGAMWQMLCKSGKDLEVRFSNIEVDGDTVRADWDADYTFSATGRKVNNAIDATFKIKDGKIIAHKDSFDFHKWSKMALPFGIGHLFGGTRLLKGLMQRVAGKQLDKFIQSQ